MALTTRVVSNSICDELTGCREGTSLDKKAYEMLSQNLSATIVKELLLTIAKMAAGLARLTLRQGAHE